MDRRSFLKAILGAAAYEPAKKIFVFAPNGGWKSSLIAPGEVIFFLESTAHGYNDWKFSGSSEMRMPFIYDADLWSQNLTVREVNNADFGIRLDAAKLHLVLNAYRDAPFIPVTNVRT